jgi:16S rRNA (cytidine1402-2'-O)-methyltransferase
LADLAAVDAGRRVAVVRELTKVHEEVLRGTVAEVADSLARREVLGEVVVVLEGAAPTQVDDATVRAALVDLLAGGASVRDAATTVAADLGVAHRDAYRAALALRAGEDRPSDQ